MCNEYRIYAPSKGNVGYCTWRGINLKEIKIENKYISIWKPNWMIEEEYPVINHAPKIQWAWEFLRRNLKYQIAFEFIDDFFYDKGLETYNTMSPHHLHIEMNQFKEHLKIVCDDFKIEGIVNPTVPYCKIMESILRFKDSLYPYPQSPRAPVSSYKYSMPRKTEEYGLKFNLTKDIKEQIKRAEKMLNEERNILIDANIIDKQGSTIHYNKFQHYLRIFDARKENVPYNDIAKILYPDEKNKYPDFPIKKKIASNYKAACSYVEYKYSEIASKHSYY